MKITLATIGKWKKGPEKDLFEHFAARLHWPLDLRELEDKKPGAPDQQKQREGALLLAATAHTEILVVLDERGRALSSEGFAGCFREWQNRSVSQVGFVIGGAYGLDKAVLDAAHVTLALGTMTWPHLLVRGLLAEQIYRAQCILAGHPYHHG